MSQEERVHAWPGAADSLMIITGKGTSPQEGAEAWLVLAQTLTGAGRGNTSQLCSVRHIAHQTLALWCNEVVSGGLSITCI